MRISDWSSDVCSSDLGIVAIPVSVRRKAGGLGLKIFELRDIGRDVGPPLDGADRPVSLQADFIIGNRLRAKSLIRHQCAAKIWRIDAAGAISTPGYAVQEDIPAQLIIRSEEHTSELQSLMRIS